MCDRRNTVSFDLKHDILRQLNVKGKEKEMFLPYLSIHSFRPMLGRH